MQDFLKPGWNW